MAWYDDIDEEQLIRGALGGPSEEDLRSARGQGFLASGLGILSGARMGNPWAGAAAGLPVYNTALKEARATHKQDIMDAIAAKKLTQDRINAKAYSGLYQPGEDNNYDNLIQKALELGDPTSAQHFMTLKAAALKGGASGVKVVGKGGRIYNPKTGVWDAGPAVADEDAAKPTNDKKKMEELIAAGYSPDQAEGLAYGFYHQRILPDGTSVVEDYRKYGQGGFQLEGRRVGPPVRPRLSPQPGTNAGAPGGTTDGGGGAVAGAGGPAVAVDVAPGSMVSAPGGALPPDGRVPAPVMNRIDQSRIATLNAELARVMALPDGDPTKARDVPAIQQEIANITRGKSVARAMPAPTPAVAPPIQPPPIQPPPAAPVPGSASRYDPSALPVGTVPGSVVRGAKPDTAMNASVETLATAYGKTGIEDMERILADLKERLAPYVDIDPKTGKMTKKPGVDVPGMGMTGGDWPLSALTEEGRKIAQPLQELQNLRLYDLSGKAVTSNELVRQLKASGNTIFGKDNAVIDWVNRIEDLYAGHKANVLSRADPKVLDEYMKRRRDVLNRGEAPFTKIVDEMGYEYTEDGSPTGRRFVKKDGAYVRTK